MNGAQSSVSARPRAGRFFAQLCVIALLLLCALPLSTQAQELPTLTGRVVDGANIINAGIERDLNTLLTRHEQATGNQVVVVTVPDLQGYPIEEFALALGRGWGIGQKGKNNGAILLVAPTERKVRIEVGYGLEGTLPDATAKTIIDQLIVPAFKSGRMSQGIQNGAQAIVAVLAGDDDQVSGGNSSGLLWFERALRALIILLFLARIVMMLREPPERRYPKKSPWDHQTDPNNPFRYSPKDFHRRRGLGLFLGGGSRGGFSGGGFSGGGGSFGGGGASGGW